MAAVKKLLFNVATVQKVASGISRRTELIRKKEFDSIGWLARMSQAELGNS
ncbi:hypothetical protein [Rhodobacter sp. CZR27]|uniref:hypothetical protein n=1 Tax=Rhodobacter sp. CZR27 TaxID=2033869 RepID=UPI0018E07515|nr:hypothetical protein [Rhodobacter sp. CZR27]